MLLVSSFKKVGPPTDETKVDPANMMWGFQREKLVRNTGCWHSAMSVCAVSIFSLIKLEISVILSLLYFCRLSWGIFDIIQLVLQTFFRMIRVDVVITAATDATLHTWLCASADGGERGIFKILVWYSTLICVLSQSQHTNTYKKRTLCCTVIHRLNHWLTLFFSFFHPALCVDFRLFLNEVYHMLFSAWLVFKS